MSVEDELAIRALVARYADAVCRRDPDAWAATWAQDCRWDLGGGRVTSGREQTLDLWRTAIAKYDWVGQIAATGVVEVDHDRARGWWYVIEFNQRAQGDGTLHLGHYDDEYVRTQDGWRFASRTMHMVYRGALDRGVVTPLPPRGAPRPGSPTPDTGPEVEPDAAPGAPGDLDLFGPHFQDDPPAVYARLRRSAPVHYLPRHGWYLVTKAETAREVLRDAQRFSSRVHKHTQPPPEVAGEVEKIRAQGWPYTPALGTSDAPDHTRLRRLVQRAFSPRSLAWMEPLVRRTAEELAAALPDGAEVDFLAAFAEPLPVWAISRVLGLPESRRADIRRWSVAAAASIGGMPDAEAWIENERTLLHYQQTMAAAVEQARREPGEGVLSALVQAADHPDPGEEPIPMAQLLTLLRELVIAGNETSGKLLTEIASLLDARPGEWDRIRAEPERARAVVEEALRFATPSQTAFRRATADTRLAGVDIPAGAVLVVAFASANRDEDIYADPARFDPDRDGLQHHLAFGMGKHACIGSPLARMEAVISVQVLAEQIAALTVIDRGRLRYNASFMVRGLLELPVRVRRRPAA